MTRVLVTGGAGFIGHHFINHLLVNTDWEIIVLDKLNYASCGWDRVRDINVFNPKRVSLLSADFSHLLDQGLVKEIGDCDYIFHIGAETHVDNSILNPEPFVMSNVVGTMRLLDLARTMPNLKKMFVFSCYDQDTFALTKNGIKKFDEIKVDDKVLSINPKTGELEEKDVEAVIIQDYEGDMYHFESSRADIKVTPNHRMFFVSSKEGIQVEEASEVAKRSVVHLPRGNWKGEDQENIFLEGIGYVKTEDLFYLCGIFIGDGFTAKQIKIMESKSGLTKLERMDLARDSETGRFINTGKIGPIEVVTSTSWRIFFDIPVLDKARERLENTLQSLNIKYSAHSGKSGEHIYFSSKEWLKFFEQFGKGAENKNIPSWMLEYDKKYLKCLFEGLIDSDGYYGKSHIQYTTISKKLLKDICELGFKLGRYPFFRKRYSESIFENRVIKGYAYYINFPLQDVKIGNKNVKIENYKGKIWCLKVKDNKNFIVARNGKLAFCGNTDEVYGHAPDGVAYKEWDRHNPTNPYSASKSGGEMLALSYANTYGVPVVITNCMNVFGERQHPEKFIPKALNKILKGEKVTLHYYPGKERPGARFWIHARNVAAAIMFLIDHGKVGEKYNIVGEKEVDNLEIAKMISKITGKELNYEIDDTYMDRPGHDLRYALDGTKMKEMGWHIPIPFEQSFEKTVRWMVHDNNLRWLDISTYSKLVNGKNAMQKVALQSIK